MIINIFICMLAATVMVEGTHMLYNIYRYVTHYKLRKVKHTTTATIARILRRP